MVTSGSQQPCLGLWAAVWRHQLSVEHPDGVPLCRYRWCRPEGGLRTVWVAFLGRSLPDQRARCSGGRKFTPEGGRRSIPEGGLDAGLGPRAEASSSNPSRERTPQAAPGGT